VSTQNGHGNYQNVSSIHSEFPEISIPPRILMGAGPSASYPEALRAMSANTLGHLDPAFLGIMADVGAMLRRVFLTKNPITGAVSGTGTAGMEAALINLIEPGDEVLVCVFGYFSHRMSMMARRMGAEVTVIEAPWGRAFEPEQIEAALKQMKAPKVVAVVHAETSTGILQPIDEIIQIAHRYGALVIADCVTSLAGCPLRIDEWDVDVCFSGTQKCIGSPPGLSPITFSERAMQKIRDRNARGNPVTSWYLDMSLVETYWGDTGAGGRAYHHTAPSNALFGLYEALRLVLLEGLENRWARHELHSRALMAGLAQLGLTPYAQEGFRLNQLNAVHIPEGIDDVTVRGRLLKDYHIEISGGLGDAKGKIWRIGVMGYSAQRENIIILLTALEDILSDLGHKFAHGAALEAAQAIYHEHESKKVRLPVGTGETIGAEEAAGESK
jgi:alanine-glyoxylate transaminase / serine-glyoxylate transaminase / serine-pyruvate transaminase